MKNLIIVVSIGFIVLLTGCTGDDVSSQEITNRVEEEEIEQLKIELEEYKEKLQKAEEQIDQLRKHTATSNTIGVTGSITLSRNDLFELTRKHEYLSVVQTSGKYFEDWFPGAYMGRTWRGGFQIQLSDEDGKVKSALDLNAYFNDEVVFNSFFDIAFDDYNGDGNIDFTIGQYLSGNVNIYKLFTLDKTGRIEELHIKEHPELFVSDAGRYSAKLTKTEMGFSSSYYDNRIGKTVKETFVWNGEEFASDK